LGTGALGGVCGSVLQPLTSSNSSNSAAVGQLTKGGGFGVVFFAGIL
jgi:hypothetical protein